MPEIRKDPIINRWVIIAENRAARPNEYDRQVRRQSGLICPFCAGHEEHTPGSLATYTLESSTSPWQVRVVPNLYPVLVDERSIEKRSTNFLQSVTGSGVHEVVIESPNHIESPTGQTAESFALVLRAYRDRILAARDVSGLAHALVFKNVGPAAGASIEHSHSQLIGLPIVPSAVAHELEGCEEFLRTQGDCVFCRMLNTERAGERRVDESEHFIAFCPFASCFPFETWILPRRHESHFEAIDAEQLLELSDMLRRCIARIEKVGNRPAFNHVIHSAPFDTNANDHYHWHIEILPRITTAAGFEWGTGCYINPIRPEEAALALRNVEANYLA